MIHIAIVEDEAFYVQQIQNYMERYQQESQREISVTVYSDGEDILDNYKGDYDIILMDIQMRFMDGMTAAKNIRKLDDAVVIMFITNMTQYAVQGYEVDALDYIIKPVEYFAFSQKLEKAVGRIRRRKRFYVTIPVEEGIQKLDVSSIYYNFRTFNPFIRLSYGNRSIFYGQCVIAMDSIIASFNGICSTIDGHCSIAVNGIIFRIYRKRAI